MLRGAQPRAASSRPVRNQTPRRRAAPSWRRRASSACRVRGRPRPCRRCRAAREFRRSRREFRKRNARGQPRHSSVGIVFLRLPFAGYSCSWRAARCSPIDALSSKAALAWRLCCTVSSLLGSSSFSRTSTEVHFTVEMACTTALPARPRKSRQYSQQSRTQGRSRGCRVRL